MNTRNSLNTGVTGALSRWLQLLAAVAALVILSGCESPEERVANYVASAEQLLEEENLVKAELEAKNALQIEPKNADARYILASIARTKNEFNDVVGNLLIAIESRPGFIKARAELGTLYVQAGRPELAEVQLVELEKLAPEHTETRVLRARLLANRGELEQATDELKAAIESEPDNIIAMGMLAMLALNTDVNEALAIVDEAIAKIGENKTVESKSLRLLKIDILTKSGRREAAEAAYRSLINNFPDERDYRIMLARVLAEEGKIEDVDDVLKAAIDHDPSDQEAKLMLIRFVAGTRSTEEGVALLQDFVEQDPAATELRMLLAKQYLSDGDTEGAQAEFEKVVEIEGNEDAGLTARTSIAGIYISKGEVEAGTAIVDEVLALDPLNANANYLHGLVNFMDSNWKGAVSDLRTALREAPDNARAQWLLARTHASAGDLVLAEDAYRRLLTSAPLNVAASLELTRLLVDQKELDKAEAFLAEKIGAMPRELALSKARMGILVSLKRFDDAIAEAQRFGSMPDSAAIGSYFAGGIYQAWDQHDKAVVEFRKALEAQPDAREPVQGLVVSLTELGKADEARDYLQGLSAQYPENLQIKMLLGQVLARTGEQGAAREVFESTLSDKSDWLPAYAALAGLETGNPEAQMDLYRRGLEAAPGNAQMALLLGTSYERSGDFEKAIATYEEVLAVDPSVLVVANNLAALLADHRQDTASFNRALEVSKQLEDSDEPMLLDTLGWVYYRLGDYDNAQRLLSRAVEGEPGIPVLRYHLGMNYLAQNKQQLAIEQLRAATESSDVQYPGRDEAEKSLAKLLEAN